MKTIRLSFIMIIFVAIASCNSDDDLPASASAVENTVKSGMWKITRFEDTGNNETSKFNGYNFVFDANGTLTAANGTNLFTGTWSVTDDGSHDDNSHDLDFNIHFNVNNSFEELNEDWHFISFSPSKIELIHVSGGNGGTHYLTFERI